MIDAKLNVIREISGVFHYLKKNVFHYSSIPTSPKPRRNYLFSHFLFWQETIKHWKNYEVSLHRKTSSTVTVKKNSYYCGAALQLVKMTACGWQMCFLIPLVFSCLHLLLFQRYPSHREVPKMRERCEDSKEQLDNS